MTRRVPALLDRVLGRPPAGNTFGVAEAFLGLAAGFVLSIIALSAYDSIAHVSATADTYGQDVVGFFALWAGLVGAVVVACRLRMPAAAGAGLEARGSGSIVTDVGLTIRPLVDLPLGAAVGIASQYLLVPLLEWPLQPFVPHLAQKLGHPARQLLGPATSTGTAALVVIAVLICVGSPLVEELFFRGLLLRGLLGLLGPRVGRLAPGLSIVVTGLLFALVHFEALQFLALAGFGMVLGLLAWRSGRLGPSIVAHVAFNATTVIAYVRAH